jgi:starch synthase
MRYGCVPVVARVGGLADTVVDANEAALAGGAGTGVQFVPVVSHMLALAIDRTTALWRDHTVWRGLQRRAMAVDVGWSRPAKRYAQLYRELVASRAA